MFMCFPAFLFFGNWWFLECRCPPVHAGTVGVWDRSPPLTPSQSQHREFVSNLCAEICKQNKPEFSSHLGEEEAGWAPWAADRTEMSESMVAGKSVGVIKPDLVQMSQTGSLQQAQASAEPRRSRAPGWDSGSVFLWALTWIGRLGAGSVFCQLALFVLW